MNGHQTKGICSVQTIPGSCAEGVRCRRPTRLALRTGGAAVLVALAVAACAPAPPPTISKNPPGRTPSKCADPGVNFKQATPESVDVNSAALTKALAFAAGTNAQTVAVLRHGCLIATGGTSQPDLNTPVNVWSVTKAVVSTLVGRAYTLGKLGLDDPIGKYLPEADAAHGAITVRQLLTETSGLSFAWLNDLLANGSNAVNFELSLPFAHAPGTYFEYAQQTITLLAKVVERAVGEDLQDFARTQLFRKVGIPDNDWSWTRDGAGNTFGYAFLSIAPIDLARLGLLVLHDGRWHGRTLIAADYVHQGATPTSTNHGYGFLWWTNAGGSVITPEPYRQELERSIIPSMPSDTFSFDGLLDQVVVMVPSLDLVVVRTGLPGNQTGDFLQNLTIPGDGISDFFRLLGQSITDVKVADPGPWVPDPVIPLNGGSLFNLLLPTAG